MSTDKNLEHRLYFTQNTAVISILTSICIFFSFLLYFVWFVCFVGLGVFCFIFTNACMTSGEVVAALLCVLWAAGNAGCPSLLYRTALPDVRPGQMLAASALLVVQLDESPPQAGECSFFGEQFEASTQP